MRNMPSWHLVPPNSPTEPAKINRFVQVASEKDAELAQKSGQPQPFQAMFPQECMDRLAYFGPILQPNTFLAQGARRIEQVYL